MQRLAYDLRLSPKLIIYLLTLIIVYSLGYIHGMEHNPPPITTTLETPANALEIYKDNLRVFSKLPGANS